VLDLKALLDWILDLRYFHPDEVLDGRTAIPYLRADGDPESRFVLVLGENAGGKSFFRRLVRLATSRPRAKDKDKGGPFPVHEIIHLSMEGRAGGMAFSSMVYGSENWQSTGQNSAHTVLGGIKTATGRDHEVIVYWDEPDLGMSAACAAGVGVALKDFTQEAPEHVQAVFVTTHSPALVAQLLHCEARPYYLYLGSQVGPQTIEDWVKYQTDLVWTPIIGPEKLAEVSYGRFKDIQAILNDTKKG